MECGHSDGGHKLPKTRCSYFFILNRIAYVKLRCQVYGVLLVAVSLYRLLTALTEQCCRLNRKLLYLSIFSKISSVCHFHFLLSLIDRFLCVSDGLKYHLFGFHLFPQLSWLISSNSIQRFLWKTVSKATFYKVYLLNGRHNNY